MSSFGRPLTASTSAPFSTAAVHHPFECRIDTALFAPLQILFGESAHEDVKKFHHA
jgi:hypothetical protein